MADFAGHVVTLLTNLEGGSSVEPVWYLFDDEGPLQTPKVDAFRMVCISREFFFSVRPPPSPPLLEHPDHERSCPSAGTDLCPVHDMCAVLPNFYRSLTVNFVRVDTSCTFASSSMTWLIPY